MSTVPALLLSMAMLAPALDPRMVIIDTATLREMLYDTQHAHKQSQAALLLLQNQSPDADEIIREGLHQTSNPEVALALISAIRLQHETRFATELLAAFSSPQVNVRQFAGRTLADLADGKVIARLQTVVEDPKADALVRQTAVWTLGRSGQRSAATILMGQLDNPDDAMRQAAVDALSELSGQTYGLNLVRWRAWWQQHRDLSAEQWLAERLAYQSNRSRRLEGELERTKGQIVRLHQQLYSRLPAGDRLGHVQSLADSEDPAVRSLAVGWSAELLPGADAVGQRALTDLLLQWSNDGSPEVQHGAALALGSTKDPRAFDQLTRLLREGGPTVRAAAARAVALQAKGSGAAALERQRQVVPALQKALDDPALEVVVEAAESLGALGIPEAGPVLTVLLRHPSRSVRQTAAQALERVADVALLDDMLEALEDPAVTVRFSLVGAVGHAVADGHTLAELQRARLVTRLDGLLSRDADPGVRSRAATVLGQCGTPAVLPALWRRVVASEESRVQEKAWAACIEIMVRAGSLDLLREWDHKLEEAKQGARRLQLLTETAARWQKREDSRQNASAALEMLVEAQLAEGKWAAALPWVHELLAGTPSDAELDRRLRWLLTIGEQALNEGDNAEALHAVQEAQPFLKRRTSLAADFEKLEKQAK
jgi:HEAT repeat protein